MSTTPDAPVHRVVRKTRVRAMLFLIAAVVAGAAAVFLVKVYLDQAARRSASALDQSVPVVIATTEIPSGQPLAEPQLRIVRWPAGQTPSGTFQRIEEVVGQTPRQTLVAGEPVLAGRLASRSEGQGLAAILEKGARAMAVKVDQVVGIAGFVQPGDRVDVITTITVDEETRGMLATKPPRISKIILQDVLVLAVGEHLTTDGAKPVTVQVVTLQVQPDESERLALASQFGKIQLTMRARVDRDMVATAGVTPLALLGIEPRPPAPAPPPPVETKPEPPVHHHTRVPEPKVVIAPVTPPAPTVEILRGTQKVEERKLKPLGGTQ